MQLARAQFLQQQNSPQSIQKSPELSNQRTRRPRKDFQNRSRSSDSTTEIKEGSDTKHRAISAARSISSSLRNRFRRAFSKPLAGLPPQQLDASRAHFGDSTFGGPDNGGFDSYLQDDVSDLRRGSIYDDPWHEKVDEEALHRLSSIAPINRSAGNLTASSKSRVTSWTNSNTNGSIEEAVADRKSLSVIQEDGGPYQPSSSAGRHIRGVSVSHKPLPTSPGQVPDPRRLYSALVKRMNQESEEREAESQRELIRQEVECITDNHEVHEPLRQTVRAVTKSTTAGSPDLEHQPHVDLQERSKILGYNFSEESIYSRNTDGEAQPYHRRLNNTSEQTFAAYQQGPSQYDLINTQNPFQNSDISLSQAQNRGHATQLQQDACHGLDAERSTAHIRHTSVCDAQYRVMPTTDVDHGQEGLEAEIGQSKQVSHVRKNAQIKSEHSQSPSKYPYERTTTTCTELQLKGSHTDIRGSDRTPTPPSHAPDQLSVAKRRFPLLNVKQVSKNNTPVPSRNSSLTRSQSGLLQQAREQQLPPEEAKTGK